MQTELTQKAYLYYQYQDDLDLKLIMDVHNEHLQAYLDAFNDLNLPIYTQHAGIMLDWVAKGIYGFERPVIATGESVAGVGGFNNYSGFASLPFLAFTAGTSPNYKELNDDEFKRLLQWHLFLGDGFVFNIEWLKRRIKRFISDWFSVIDDTSDISISLPVRQSQIGIGAFCSSPFASIPFLSYSQSSNQLIDFDSTWTITITTTPENYNLANTLKWLVAADKLALPINNKYEIILL